MLPFATPTLSLFASVKVGVPLDAVPVEPTPSLNVYVFLLKSIVRFLLITMPEPVSSPNSFAATVSSDRCCYANNICYVIYDDTSYNNTTCNKRCSNRFLGCSS